MLTQEYKHIAWQPCLAHTINLMLKDIGDRPEHTGMIAQCKRISSWLHNYNTLHTMMTKAIGGELVKWNATRFGTNYMFLDSFYRRKGGFMQWMGSEEFLSSKFASTPDGRFAHSRLSSMDWWDNLNYVIKCVEPLYKFLRFADEDKRPNFSQVMITYQSMKNEYESFFGENVSTCNEYFEVIDARIRDVQDETYVSAGKSNGILIPYEVPLFMFA